MPEPRPVPPVEHPGDGPGDHHETRAMLVEQVAEGRAATLTAHQQSCPDCHGRLVRLARAWAAVDDAASTTVEAPSGLPSAILHTLRALGREHVLVALDGGRTMVSGRVLALVATVAVHRVDGLVSLLDVTVRGGRIALAVSLDVHRPLPELADEVRSSVTAELGRMGVPTLPVDVHVHDVEA